MKIVFILPLRFVSISGYIFSTIMNRFSPFVELLLLPILKHSAILFTAPFSVLFVLHQSDIGGSITMTTKEEPLTVRMWHATTLDGTRRDFRLATGPNPSEPTPHPVIWFYENVTKVYVAMHTMWM